MVPTHLRQTVLPSSLAPLITQEPQRSPYASSIYRTIGLSYIVRKSFFTLGEICSKCKLYACETFKATAIGVKEHKNTEWSKEVFIRQVFTHIRLCRAILACEVWSRFNLDLAFLTEYSPTPLRTTPRAGGEVVLTVQAIWPTKSLNLPLTRGTSSLVSGPVCLREPIGITPP